MADVFISYRNTPDRRTIVRRLATILRAHEVTVWWDYGLEAGESYRAQIMTELANARIVAPLWCAESVVSRWVRMEAELGKDKLVPARLQEVAPPDAFEAIQAADLIGWDGAVGSPRVQAYVRRICERLGRAWSAPTDMIEELANLPSVPPLPEIGPAGAAPSVPPANPAHDYAFWERQWDKHGAGIDLVALGAIAVEAPRYFADQARARIAVIEAGQRREAEEARRAEERKAEERRQEEHRKAEERRRAQEAVVARYRAEGRIKMDTQTVHMAPEGWFGPGAGKAEWFKDLDVGPEMVVVPAGSFRMGSDDYSDEIPIHRVEIKAPFAVGRFSVTFAEWEASGLEHTPDEAWGRGRRPVINVSWQDAQAYASWLSQRTGKTYRLLSEAEWEYCSRAGTTTKYAFGDSITAKQAQFAARKTVEVGAFPPNDWGIYDMHGNVWEWCEDNWHANYAGEPPNDGSVWKGGDRTLRVLRGGSWTQKPWFLRSANRISKRPTARHRDIGFRVARTL